MYQGNFGSFFNKTTGEHAWLWKIRNVSGVFYMDIHTLEYYNSCQVNETGNEKYLDRPWVLEYELSADEAKKYIHFTAPDVKSLIREKSYYDMAQKVSFLNGSINELIERINSFKEQLDDAVVQKNLLQAERDDLFNELQASKKANQSEHLFTYIHGKHDATNVIEYCWYANPSLAKEIHVGDTIRVHTSRGEQLAIVTRIEHSDKYMEHKRVIEVVKNIQEDDLPY